MEWKKQGSACRWARKIGWYSEAVRTDLDGAGAKRRDGACCVACNLVSDSKPDYRDGHISDGSGIIFRKKDTADSAGRRQCPKNLTILVFNAVRSNFKFANPSQYKRKCFAWNLIIR